MEVTVPGSDVMSVSGLLKTATRLGDFFHKDPGGPGPGFHQHPRSAGCSLPMPASDISDFPTFEEARGTRQPSKLLPRVSLLGEEVRSSQWCLCSTDRRRGSPHVDGGLPVEAYSQHATQRKASPQAGGGTAHFSKLHRASPHWTIAVVDAEKEWSAMSQATHRREGRRDIQVCRRFWNVDMMIGISTVTRRLGGDLEAGNPI
ncbi:uncharacterized protein LOC132541282 isoform X2 [Erinaceus europaeus]|uniref:Uncharacterized protein LOC132541282 isoform X2 n=1 Tax=Erinaceus europaeus TaxID=9365 RepID=A0ABM3Y7I4_ERIEU|nr:uncharacterized protein LOC132541282 isoform X2 [Erinaceus europaeus]